MGAGPGSGWNTAAQQALETRIARLEAEVALLRERLGPAPLETIPTPAIPAPAVETIQSPHAAPPPYPSPPIPPSGVSPGCAGPASVVAAASPQSSFEDRLGSQWFNRIGIALLLLGTAWFLKLAVERGWIVPSPVARVIAGLLAGAGLVLWSERFRHRGFSPFSYSLKALGTGVLYLSLWAAFRLYGLVPPAVALVLMIAVTAWNAFMAWAQNAELLAAYALAGALATPALLSTSGNQELFLFAYLLAIDLATVVLVRARQWPRLLLGAFPVTVAYFIAWYVVHFTSAALGLTSVLLALLGVTFAMVPLGAPGSVRSRGANAGIEEIGLPLANAAFLALAFYSVLQDSGLHAWLPWMVVLLGAAYLALVRVPQSRTAIAIHLSIAVVLLTIAVPLKASGHWITAGWLVEGLALVWVTTRLSDTESASLLTLRWLAACALGLGLCGALLHLGSFATRARVSLWSNDIATALLAVGIFVAAAWLARLKPALWRSLAPSVPVAIGTLAILLAAREVVFSWSFLTAHPPLRSAAFGAALLGLAILAGAEVFARSQATRGSESAPWLRTAATSSVVLHLFGVLTGVREVASIWPTHGTTDPDAALKQGLAISGFLMLYGALLLANGFWRRRALLRWQGLILLLFTILKTFLYDMRNLSQGYRVTSFLALGALLLAISYAYQRDWLGLRGVSIPASAPARNSEAQP